MFSECHVFKPPNPVAQFYYQCDKMFHLDELLKLYVEHDTYAIVLISGKRTDFYSYSENNTKLIKSINVELPSQFRCGGSSSMRLGRIRDEKIGWYLTSITEQMVKLLVKDNIFQHLGLYIAGPSELKKQVQEEHLFIQHFQKYLNRVFTIVEIHDQSVYEVIKLINNTLNDNYILSDFELLLETQFELMVFGNKVFDLLENGELQKIYIDENRLHTVNMNSKIKVIIIDSLFKKKYGIVGIRYYKVDDYGNNTEEEI